MKKNMGNMDRIVRLVIAAVLTALYFLDVISGTLGLVLVVISLVFLVTSLSAFCPLYAIFGLRTCPAPKE